MKFETENKNISACIDSSWETKQERTLNKYLDLGDSNSFDSHLEYLKKLGYSAYCEVKTMSNQRFIRIEKD